jgi:DNA repair exonuclease SbcCD ATPase subunit
VDQESKAKDYQKYLEQQILKLNYKSFTQVVILGSSTFVPFMELTAANRREVIEDLLDIQVFSRMNLLLKQRVSDLKESINKNDYDIDLTKEKIDIQKENIETNSKTRNENIERNEEIIAEELEQIEKYTKECDALHDTINSLMSSITDRNTTIKKIVEYNDYETRIKSNLNRVKKEHRFFTDNSSCNTCGQNIDENFRQNKVKEKEDRITELENGMDVLNEKMGEVQERNGEIEKINKRIQHLNTQIQSNNAQIVSHNTYVTKLQQDNKELRNQDDTSTEAKDRLDELNGDLDKLNVKKDDLSTESHYLDVSTNMLKDSGIKAKIIKQYLPIMNKLINKYLIALDFYVNFELDETFNETIKSRHRDEFSYASFSEGEKFRIDISLLLTWREIAKARNSTNTNLLVLDEVFDSSLDVDGTEEFLKLLHSLDSGTNVFVISHKSEALQDKFQKTLKFEKINNFSKIV